MNWIKSRISERTTYIGIFTLLGLCGYSVPEDYRELLLQVLTAIGGIVLVAMKEKDHGAAATVAVNTNTSQPGGLSGVPVQNSPSNPPSAAEVALYGGGG